MNRILNQTYRLAVMAAVLTVTSAAWASDPATKEAVATAPATKDAAATAPAAKDDAAKASKKAKKAHRDVGINQPGAAGNVGHPATPVAGPNPGVPGPH